MKVSIIIFEINEIDGMRAMLPQIRAHSDWRAAEKRGIPAKPGPV